MSDLRSLMADFFETVQYDEPPDDWRLADTWDDPDDGQGRPKKFKKEQNMIVVYEMTRDGPRKVGTVDGDKLTGDVALLSRLQASLEDKSEAGWLKRYRGSRIWAERADKAEKHQGPGDHPSGSPQSIHAGAPGASSPKSGFDRIALRMAAMLDKRGEMDSRVLARKLGVAPALLVGAFRHSGSKYNLVARRNKQNYTVYGRAAKGGLRAAVVKSLGD